MALSKDIDLHGLQIEGAYWRCDRFTFTSQRRCRAHFEMHASQQASRVVNAEPLMSEVVDFTYDIDSEDNLVCQAYNAAKKIPLFEGAEDC